MPTQAPPKDADRLREPRSYGTATKSEGPEIPQVEDGEYRANVKDVKETTSSYNGEEKDQFVIEFELLDLHKGNGDYQTLRSYIAIPPTLITDGKLNENSNLYAFLTALYGDLDPKGIVVEPLEWIGEELRVIVENKAVKEGQNAGQLRPRITKFMRKKVQPATRTPAAAARPQPAAARASAPPPRTPNRPAPATSNDDDF